MVSIQRPEYGGGEIYFDGKLIRKNGSVSSETTALAKLALTAEPYPAKKLRLVRLALAR